MELQEQAIETIPDPPGMPEEDVVWFRPDVLEPWPDLNPRRHFDPEKLEELRASIAKHGVLQNIVVHETGRTPKWVVAGESRWRVARELGVWLPCRIRTFTKAEALRIALLENLQRNDLRPTEEARGFKELLALEPELTEERLGQEIGKSTAYISNRIRLLRLPEAVQVLVDERAILASHARDILMPWADEEAAVATRFFGIIAQQVRTRPDASDPATKTWLTSVVEQIGKILRPAAPPKAAAPEKPAPAIAATVPAPAPAAPPEAAPKSKATKPAPKPRAAKEPPTPPTPPEAAAPATTVEGEPAATAEPKPLPPEARAALRKALGGGTAADTRWRMRAERGMSDEQLKAFVGVELGKVGRRLSDGTTLYAYRGGDEPAFWWGTEMDAPPALAGQALLDIVREVLELPPASGTVEPPTATPAASTTTSEPAAPPAAPVAATPAPSEPEATPDPATAPAPAGFWGHLVPVLGDYVLTISVSRPDPAGPLCLTVVPAPIDGGKPLAPLTITRAAEDLDAEVPAELAPFLAALPRNPAAPAVDPSQSTLF